MRTAIGQGHDVTVFNRGSIPLDAEGPCKQLIGDRRTGDLSPLEQGRWDAVIDGCGYTAADVARTAKVLQSRVGHYCFISTSAVYADKSQITTEDTPLVPAFTAVPNDRDLISHYAELKVACEQELQALIGPRLSIVRLGVIVGAGDYTDRLNYWVRRVGRGGLMLGPPRAEQPLQLLHARDMAESVLSIVSAGKNACVNLAGPEMTFAELIRACVTASGSDVDVMWGGPESLPLAISADGSHDGAYRVTSNAGNLDSEGWQPIEGTCREILTWDEQRGRPPLRPGIPSDEAEQALIAELSGQLAVETYAKFSSRPE